LSKETHQKNIEDTQHARPLGALRCSNDPAGCELANARTAHPEVPGPSCASRRDWTGGLSSRAKTKDQRQKKNSISLLRYASRRNPFF